MTVAVKNAKGAQLTLLMLAWHKEAWVVLGPVQYRAAEMIVALMLAHDPERKRGDFQLPYQKLEVDGTPWMLDPECPDDTIAFATRPRNKSESWEDFLSRAVSGVITNIGTIGLGAEVHE